MPVRISFFRRLLDFFFPRYCAICGRELAVSDHAICTVCNWHLPRTRFHEAPRDKPYPEQLFYTLNGIISKEKINAKTVWMVGDSQMDSMCAKSAGVRAVRIGSPIWDGIKEPEDGITFFANMREFYNYLLKETGENR